MEYQDKIEGHIVRIVDEHIKLCKEQGAPAVHPGDCVGDVADSFSDFLVEHEVGFEIALEIARRVMDKAGI